MAWKDSVLYDAVFQRVSGTWEFYFIQLSDPARKPYKLSPGQFRATWNAGEFGNYRTIPSAPAATLGFPANFPNPAWYDAPGPDPEPKPVPDPVVCPEGRFRASPDDPNVIEWCQQGVWRKVKTCGYGVDPLFPHKCNTAPVLPPEPGTVRRGKRIEIDFKDSSSFMSKLPGINRLKYSGGGLAALIKNKAVLVDKIQKKLPDGWKFNNLDIENGKLSLVFEEEHSPFLLIAGIVAVVVGVLIIFGLIVRSWKVYDWKKAEAQARIETQETEQGKTDAEILQELIDSGVIKTAEDAALVITAMNKPDPETSDTFDDIKEMLVFAVGAVIIIMLVTNLGKKR